MAPYTTRAQNQLMYDLESVVVHQSEAGKGEIEKGHYFTYSQRGHQVYLSTFSKYVPLLTWVLVVLIQ